MHDWIELSFKDIIKNGNVSYGIVQPGSNEVSENSIPILRIYNFKNRRLVINDIFYVHKDIECKYARTRLNGSELLITVVGTIGQCIVVPQKLKGWNVARAIAVAQVKDNFNKCFIASQFEDEYIKFQIYGSMNDTVQPTLNLKELKEIKFRIPPLAEQDAIAGVLGSLDDKIDLLQRQNATLEAMAETLFRQWFIEEAQEDWEEFSLDCIADNIKEQAIPVSLDCNTPYVGLEHIDKKNISLNRVGVSSDISSNKFYFSKYDILFGKLRPYFHKVCFAPFNGVCSTDILVIRPKQKAMLPFCLFAFFQKDIIDFSDYASSGTRMPRTSWNILSQYKMKKPPYDKIKKFNIICQKYIDKIEKNQQQIRTLEKLRDTLLPKLMSGEVRVRVDE